MHRRIFCRIIAVMLLVTGIMTVSGCSRNASYEKLLDRDSPVTITIWHYYNGVQQAQFDEMVTEFNDTVGMEKGIVVEAVSKESIDELADSVMSSARKDPGAEKLPDIFATYAETAYIVDELGYVADLRKYFPDDEIGEYVESYIEEGDFKGDGSLKIFPIAKSTEVLMVNKTDWQKFSDATGDSLSELTTYEGIAKVAEDYYNYTDGLTPDKKNDGKAFFGMDSVANYMDISAKELGRPFTFRYEDGRIGVDVDKKAMRKIWTNYYVPYVKGYFAADSRFRSDDAKIGEIIAYEGSTTGAVYFPTEVTINDSVTYPIECIVLPAPSVSGCDRYMVQQGAGMCVVSSSEKKEYASTIFLKWFTDTERNICFSVKSGYLPVKKEAADTNMILSVCEKNGIEMSKVIKDTLFTAMHEIDECGMYFGPVYDKSHKLREYIGSALEDSAAQACKSAKQKIAAGYDRDTVMEEYTGNMAFEKWYSDFESGFLDIADLDD